MKKIFLHIRITVLNTYFYIVPAFYLFVPYDDERNLEIVFFLRNEVLRAKYPSLSLIVSCRNIHPINSKAFLGYTL